MKKPRVIVTQESDTGRNQKFRDTKNKERMTRAQFVKKIRQGVYSGYYVRKMNGVQTPVSKPNGFEEDNLG